LRNQFCLNDNGLFGMAGRARWKWSLSRGGEVGVGLGMETFNLVVEPAFHAQASSLIRIMPDLVPMFPLIPG